MRLRARSRPACFPSCRAALSLIARSLLPPQCPDVIAAAPSSSRYRPGVSSRLGAYRPLCPFPIPCPIAPRLACFAPVIAPSPDVIAAVPSARLLASSSPHPVAHRACGSRPPRLSPRPTCRETGRGYGLAARCWAVRLSLPCLVASIPFPRLGRLARRFISSPSSSREVLLPRMCRLRVRAEPCGRFACFAVRAF